MLRCKFENGHHAKLRHVTVDALIIKDQQILLIFRSPASLTCPNLWALPGGFADHNERLDEAIAREVCEETGFLLKNPSLFIINDKPDRYQDNRQNINFLYTASPGKQITSHDDEVTEVKWFSLNELPVKESFAFDHWYVIQKYLEFQKKPFSTPLMNFDY